MFSVSAKFDSTCYKETEVNRASCKEPYKIPVCTFGRCIVDATEEILRERKTRSGIAVKFAKTAREL